MQPSTAWMADIVEAKMGNALRCWRSHIRTRVILNALELIQRGLFCTSE